MFLLALHRGDWPWALVLTDALILAMANFLKSSLPGMGYQRVTHTCWNYDLALGNLVARSLRYLMV